MIKHSWNKDECVHCGIRREKKYVNMFIRSYSYLSNSGIFEERNVYEERLRYHYYDLDGHGFGIDRPDCVREHKTNEL